MIAEKYNASIKQFGGRRIRDAIESEILFPLASKMLDAEETECYNCEFIINYLTNQQIVTVSLEF